jgi:hypothetical protein
VVGGSVARLAADSREGVLTRARQRRNSFPPVVACSCLQPDWAKRGGAGNRDPAASLRTAETRLVIGTLENAAETHIPRPFVLAYPSPSPLPSLRVVLAWKRNGLCYLIVMPCRNLIFFSARDVGFAFAYSFSFPHMPFPLPSSATESCRRLRFHASLIHHSVLTTHHSPIASSIQRSCLLFPPERILASHLEA